MYTKMNIKMSIYIRLVPINIKMDTKMDKNINIKMDIH